MPIGIGTAIAGGAAILGAGATIYSSSKSAKATKNAANTAAATQQANTNENNQLARDIYASNKAGLDPYSALGLSASTEYSGLLGLTPTATPATNPTTPVTSGTTPKPTMSGGALSTMSPAPTTPATSALGSYNNNSALAAQAQQAIAAGADPAAVRARAASMGVSI